MAGAHQLRQHGLHARQVSHFLAHVLELVLGQTAGFLAMGAILQPQPTVVCEGIQNGVEPPASAGVKPGVSSFSVQ